MNDVQLVQIIAMLGWLILAGGALASHRLQWKEGLRLALIWGVLFLSAGLLFTLFMD
ncbi:hypothetical protein HME9302_01164 [Alteripontixanthobacter maritimus]|uniref:Uncharacterized protein n=1 Tax=Alteripontixanthobacter maritimus TaxID=2161824 RepID=A0A369Q9U3_9SPHN|nr:hypothetical protein [Alteripontixanthobacter maritimus]RDC59966.1 hypothetical protein HME9302_01164 [Alteripontixanthobacter maritimus]